MAEIAKGSRGGSKPGERRGGRQKGTPNKKTAEAIKAIEESGVTPLQFLLDIMRGELQDPALRFEAAKAAAPYVHPRLASSELTGKGGGELVVKVLKCA